MNNLQAIILGIVQGLTEYLPVSSSAHLVLLPSFMGWNIGEQEAFVFDVLVQLGTLVGVLIYFFTPIKAIAFAVLKNFGTKNMFKQEESKLGWLVVLATIPSALIGILFKEKLAAYFSSPFAAGICLIATALILFFAEKTAFNTKTGVCEKSALTIGFAQVFALLPGISRSGSTIAAGMFCGLTRKKAAEFSFLMSIPVMLGASIVAFFDVMSSREFFVSMLTPIICGFIASAVCGYLVISWFMKFVTHRSLTFFSYYCFILGLLCMVYFK